MSTSLPTSAAPPAPRPGRYRIDPEESTVEVRTTHLFGLGRVEATFAVRSAEVLVAEPFEDSQVEAVVDSNSFNSRHRGRDKRVRSSSLLDSESHPEINFSSVSMAVADGCWTVHGILTARGREAPFELKLVEVAELDGQFAITATGTVDRYAHGITRARGLAGRHLNVTVTAITRRGD